MDTENLGGIVSSHMDEHAPLAIGGGFGVPTGGFAPAPAAGAPPGEAGIPGLPKIDLPPAAKAGAGALGSVGSSLMAARPAAIGAFGAPPPPQPNAAPPMGAAPPMMQPLLGAPPAMAMSDRRAKTSIFDGGDDLDEVLQAVHEHLMRRGHR